MSGSLKATSLILGVLSLLGLITQLTLGIMMANPGARADYPWLPKAHQHSGYTIVAVSLLYVLVSLVAILKAPTRGKVG